MGDRLPKYILHAWLLECAVLNRCPFDYCSMPWRWRGYNWVCITDTEGLDDCWRAARERYALRGEGND